ncbi:hypothetical protein [Marinobacter daepoensis]|uniref:hypothetical protein n=1 Tax=Marinobacter daepoensis TaxID=262077 RepID=UPI0006846748|nr:hypothetical protein [Marinobacter daepoensis]
MSLKYHFEWLATYNQWMNSKVYEAAGQLSVTDLVKDRGVIAALLMGSSSAYATSQCPPGFGQKDPLVDAIGWLVVSAGVFAGGQLFTYLIRRSRGIRWFPRSILIIMGFLGMILVWVGGFALGFVNFFFRC